MQKWKLARNIARQQGLDWCAEDLASAVVLWHVEHPGRSTKVDWVILEELRRMYGRGDNKHGRRRFEDIMSDLADRQPRFADPKASLVEPFLAKSHLKGEERAAVVLTYQWGFDSFEVADALGCTEGHARQLLVRARKKVSDGPKKVLANITEGHVPKLREMYFGGVKQKEMAKRLGVSLAAVRKLCRQFYKEKRDRNE